MDSLPETGGWRSWNLEARVFNIYERNGQRNIKQHGDHRHAERDHRTEYGDEQRL